MIREVLESAGLVVARPGFVENCEPTSLTAIDACDPSQRTCFQ